ncbi:MAG: L-threonylcarbamoyladenylate synthase [Pyrinomonadaceae bacterium]
MRTIVTTSVIEAAAFIKRGGVVAFPTETVYGLGANVFDAAAVAKIFEAKRRPADNPLIAHISTRDQISELTPEITQYAEKLIAIFFPGPLTVVLKKRETVPMIATAGLDTIGIRMPKFELANEFLRACGVPVVAPSANLSGRPSPTTWEAVIEDLDGRIDCVLKGEPTEIGLESTVVDCTADVPLLLRSGSISLEQLIAVMPEIKTLQSDSGEKARSPGMLHKHYSPRAKVVLIEGSDRGAGIKPSEIGLSQSSFIGFRPPDFGFDLVKKCTSVEEYAHSLFEFFRECDRKNIETIYCEQVEESGIGAALMDRLLRSAED